LKLNRFSILIYLVLLLMVALPPMARSAPKTPAKTAELALYNGSDRQQILEEGAKKEGKLTSYATGQLGEAIRPLVTAFQKKLEK